MPEEAADQGPSHPVLGNSVIPQQSSDLRDLCGLSSQLEVKQGAGPVMV